MSLLKVGLIYAYHDPINYRWAYVGSVHNQLNLERRHNQHLTDDQLLFEIWLRSMHYKGQKIRPEIMQYVGYEHVSRLYVKENEWIKKLGTLHPFGYNLALAGGPDFSSLMSQTNQRFPTLGINVGRNFGAIGARRARELHPEEKFLWFSKAGKVGGPAGNHSRWHVARGIVNLNCKLCQEAQNVPD